MSGLLVISFVAGILTVLSPCVLPLLPVIVGGSMAGEKSARRAVTVTVSLGVSVFVFTMLLKVSTAFINVPPEVWNYVSGGILLIVGLVFLFPNLWDMVPGLAKANRDTTKLMSAGFMRQNFWGDVLVGAALGPVFSTCSPTYFVVLATVLPTSLAAGVTDIFAYIIGMCGFLLVISIAGQNLLARLGLATDPKGWVRRVIGVLFIGVAAVVATGSQAAIEAPLYSIFDETKIEQNLLSNMPMPATTTATTSAVSVASSTTSVAERLTVIQKDARYQKAPELVNPDGYINTDGKPITLAQYKGKDVVLVDFWDYSCINCQRTFPYVNAWYQKYKDQGLVIIGVHTPEFAFEHLQSNVQTAVNQFGIKYPVVLDNEYQTWSAFQNEYWPREYLIDIDGYIVHDHAGEGDYEGTEVAIQQALAERAARLGIGSVATSTVTIPDSDLSAINSPETYFGSNRNKYLGNGTPGAAGTQRFTLPGTPTMNTLYFGGSWNIMPEYAEASAGATVLFEYSSHDVYMVAANSGAPVKIKVLRDGKPVGSFGGADVDANTSEATIDADRLYKLVHDPSAGTHTIEIQVEQGMLDAYTFTFG
ncbi:cytochrome c biogenesis protein/redoxin [Patescibacteria group bacterium]|nr:cytochrome c biogenesis protein/redoxin [Patescibacteria group bacterium]